MYATNRLLGFETLSPSFFGAQSPQIPVKPTPKVQTLLDAAANLPKADQLAGYEQALDAAIASKDPAGANFALRYLCEWISSNRPGQLISYLETTTARVRQTASRPALASVLFFLSQELESKGLNTQALARETEFLSIVRELDDQWAVCNSLVRLGLLSIKIRNMDKALATFSEALAASRKISNHYGISNSLLNMATIYHARGDFDNALSYYTTLLEFYRSTENKSLFASTLNNIATIHRGRGEFDIALRMYSEALAIHRHAGNQDSIAITLNNVASINLERGELDKALSNSTESLDIFRKAKNKFGMAFSLNTVAKINFLRGDVRRALRLHEEALGYMRTMDDKNGIAKSLGYISDIHKSLGDLDRSLKLLEESLEMFRTLGDKSGMSVCLTNIGNIEYSRGNFDQAMQNYDESIELLRGLGDVSNVAKCLLNIANICAIRGYIDDAYELQFESLKIGRKLGSKETIANSLDSIASLLLMNGNHDQSLSMYSESLSLRRQIGVESGLASSLINIGYLHQLRGDLEKAHAMYSESLAVHRKIEDKSGTAEDLSRLADLCMTRGDIVNAFTLFSESLQMWRDMKSQSGIAKNLISIGRIFMLRGQHEKALAIYSESLVINRKLGDIHGYAICLDSIAGIHFDCEPDKSLEVYGAALAIHRKLDNKGKIAANLINIASLYITRAQFFEARAALEEVAVILQKIDYKYLLCSQKSVYSKYYEFLGEYSKALACINESESLSRLIEDEYGLLQVMTRKVLLLIENKDHVMALKYLADMSKVGNGKYAGNVDHLVGEVYVSVGRHMEAFDLLGAAVDKFKLHSRGDTRALRVLGRSYLDIGKVSHAREPLQFALVSALRDRSPDDIAKVYSALADHALAMKDRDVAIIHLKRAIEARQVQRRGSIGLDDAMTASLSLKVAPDYRKLAGLLTDAGRLGEAMEVAELLKRSEAKVRGGDIASDAPAVQGKVSTVEAAYRKAAEDLGKLGDRERFLSKVKYPSDNVKAEVAAMPAKLKVANKALTDALNRVIAQEKAAGSAAGRMRDTGAAQARLAATLKRLGPGYAAVTVLCLPDSIRFLISTPNSLTMKRVTVAEKTLIGQVKALRDALLDPTSDPIPSAKALHTVLWAPIESELKRLGVKHVLLSLTGTARYVPFGALHNGTQYVAQGWGLSLYSPTVLEHIGDRTAKLWSVLAAGNSTERTVDDGVGSKLRFTSLPGVRAELSRVRQSVGAGPAPILDNEFTLATLKDGLAKQPSVVHLASHFQFDPRAESLSFLLTGQGEVLRASDTTVLTKDAFKGVDLLTLSACQTGTFSETADGMEVEGIASLMQRKGAGAVMSTLWPVADASTAAFMGTFYSLRAQDPRRTKAWCLREAQLRLIRGEVAPPGAPKPVATRGTTSIKVSTKGLRKDWSHPYHWAPFILQGNPL